MTYQTTTDDGLTWEVDPATGIGKRLTPIAAKRSLERRPPATTRQFPIDRPSPLKTTLSAIAADPLHSMALVHLLASNVTDQTSARNTLGSRFKLAETERAMILSAFAELSR